MFSMIKRMFRRKPSTVADYQLPSDDPELNPILIEDDSEIQLQEVATLNSRLLAPVEQTGMSARTMAVVEIKNGLGDLASHIRVLGQRLHAQSMGQSKLIEALSNLPQTIKEVIPNTQEQTNALCAMKLALDDQAEANRQFVEAMKPLPQFMQAAANLPETARKQMWALNELTKQLEEGNRATKEQGDQVKVMVEALAADSGAKSEQFNGAVEELTKLQKAQLKQAALAVKSNEMSRHSQRRHHTELSRQQHDRWMSLQQDQNRNFNRIEEHFKQSARRQMVLTGAALGLAVGAVTLAVLLVTGLVKMPGSDSQPTADAPTERSVDPNAVVEK